MSTLYRQSSFHGSLMACQKPKRFNQYLSQISEYLEHSTAHGMERIGSGPRQRSIFWIFTFTLSMIMVSFQCFLLIGQYLNYGKTISIALHDEPLKQFPHITFCSEFFVPRDAEPHPFFSKLSQLAKEQLIDQYS